MSIESFFGIYIVLERRFSKVRYGTPVLVIAGSVRLVEPPVLLSYRLENYRGLFPAKPLVNILLVVMQCGDLISLGELVHS